MAVEDSGHSQVQQVKVNEEVSSLAQMISRHLDPEVVIALLLRCSDEEFDTGWTDLSETEIGELESSFHQLSRVQTRIQALKVLHFYQRLSTDEAATRLIQELSQASEDVLMEERYSRFLTELVDEGYPAELVLKKLSMSLPEPLLVRFASSLPHVVEHCLGHQSTPCLKVSEAYISQTRKRLHADLSLLSSEAACERYEHLEDLVAYDSFRLFLCDCHLRIRSRGEDSVKLGILSRASHEVLLDFILFTSEFCKANSELGDSEFIKLWQENLGAKAVRQSLAEALEDDYSSTCDGAI